MDDVTDKELAAYGWAPGEYMIRCVDCMNAQIADKKAWRCRTCAEAYGRLKAAEKRQHEGGLPEFEPVRVEWRGTTLTAAALAPGLSLMDLMVIFEQAEADHKPVDDLAANPSVWQNARGLMAVAKAIVRAMS